MSLALLSWDRSERYSSFQAVKEKSLGDQRVPGRPKWISKVHVVANDGVFAVQLVQLFVY